MADFKTAYYSYIKPIEGGYANVVNDKGKETYAGITRINYPGWKGWPIVDSKKPLYKNGVIPRNTKFSELNALVESFYEMLWSVNYIDEIKNQDVANLLFDFFVNSGTTAFKKIQRLVNVKADGAIGNLTIAAINSANASELYKSLLQVRKEFYNAIVAEDPTQQDFYAGWMNRLKKFPAFISANKLSIAGIVGALIVLSAILYYTNNSSTKKNSVVARA
jgi:lysozyme family protein